MFLLRAAAVSFFFPLCLTVICAQQPQATEKQATSDKPSTDTSQLASEPAPAKQAPKPQKVITNDDIKSSPFAGYSGLFYLHTASVNDCDASCFDQVHMATWQPDAQKNPSWRRIILEQIDFVRSDSEWQEYLHELFDAHNKICQLDIDKQDEMRRAGNGRNLGLDQIAVSEKYDPKIQSAQEELDALVARQKNIQKRFVDKPYALTFSTLQTNRFRGGFCTQARVIYPQYQ